MKDLYLGIFVALAIFSAFFGMSQAEYKLVWSDEFEGSSLNLSKWDIEVNCWGGGNLEKQCYTARNNNIYLRDGKLHLHAIPGQYQGSHEGCTLNYEGSCTWTQPTTSGRVRSLNDPTGSFLYGKVEARLKLPKGDFLWPAFWMLPTDSVYGTWASSGEIDIMEFRGQDRRDMLHTIHYGAPWPDNRYTSSGEFDSGFDLTENFHDYTILWTPDEMVWFIDGNKTYSTELNKSFGDKYDHNRAPFDRRFHVILNLAVGGNFFDQKVYGSFDAARDVATWSSPILEVDYVRVYQDDSSSKPYCPQGPSPQTLGLNVDSAGPTHVPIYPAELALVDKDFVKISRPDILTLSSDSRNSYIKFYLPRGSELNLNATFYVYAKNDLSSSDISLYPVSDNSWNSDSLYWGNQPQSLDIPLQSIHVSRGDWYSFDISQYVGQRLSEGVNVISLVLKVGPGAAPVTISSALSSSAYSPYLLLRLNNH